MLCANCWLMGLSAVFCKLTSSMLNFLNWGTGFHISLFNVSMQHSSWLENEDEEERRTFWHWNIRDLPRGFENAYYPVTASTTTKKERKRARWISLSLLVSRFFFSFSAYCSISQRRKRGKIQNNATPNKSHATMRRKERRKNGGGHRQETAAAAANQASSIPGLVLPCLEPGRRL